MDLPLFDDATLLGVAALALAFFGSFFLKGAVGLGAITPAIVFGALVIDPHHAVLLALVVNMLSQAQYVGVGIRDGDWRIARQMLVANFAGAAVGIWIFGRLENAELSLLLGIVLGGIVLIDASKLPSRLIGIVDLQSRWVVALFSGLSGLITGITGAGGLIFLAIFLKMLTTDTRTLRGTILLLSTLFVAWRMALMVAQGFITQSILLESLLLLPFVLAGGFVGTRCFAALSAGQFHKLLRAIIVLAALGLIWKGFSGLS